MSVEIRALRESDDRSPFRSGDEALDLFFHRYAGQNQFRHHIGVTYVAVGRERILGFITVCPASLEADDLPDGRRMPPYPVPVLRIARLAVDAKVRGRGLGRALLRFGLDLAWKMRSEVGCAGVLVDSKPGSTGFYEELGFVELDVLEGAGRSTPRTRPMYIALGSIPRKGA
jgi:GNAT superfamily N-acetyltransferase